MGRTTWIRTGLCLLATLVLLCAGLALAEETPSVSLRIKGADSVAEGITDALSPMLTGFVRVLALLVLFLLLLVVIRAIAALLSGLFELPVLHGINGIFGAVFGALMAVLVLWIVLACVQSFTPMLSAEMQEKIYEALESSILSGALYSFNPAYWLLG